MFFYERIVTLLKTYFLTKFKIYFLMLKINKITKYLPVTQSTF